MSTTIGGVRIVDMPDLGAVNDASSVVGERAGSGRFSAPALTSYVSNAISDPRIFNVKRYGAKGDGATNDTTAIQAAINAGVAMGAPGFCIQIPPGIYLLTGTLTASLAANASMTLQGYGQNATELRWSSASGNGLVINYPGGANWWDHPSSATIQGLSLTTSVDTSGTALTINGNYATGYVVAQTTIRDVSIGGRPSTGQWLNGILFASVAETLLANVLITGIAGAGVGANPAPKGTGVSYAGTPTAIATQHNLVAVNIFFLDTAVNINSYIQGVLMFAVSTTSCNFGVNCPGALVGGAPDIQQVSLSQCQLACYQMCLRMTACLDCSIDGCLMFLLAGAPTNTYVMLMDSCQRMQVTGNDVQGRNITGHVGIGITNTLAIDQGPYPSIVSGCTFEALQIGVVIDTTTVGMVVGQNCYGTIGTAVQNNSDTGGFYGEFITAARAVGSALALTDSVAATVTSISLPAGDWDISAQTLFTGPGATLVLALAAGISATAASVDIAHGEEVSCSNYAVFTTVAQIAMSGGPYRFTNAARTTYYLTALGHFTTSTLSVYGTISARRIV